jgi:enoyl-CoA hydratase/carnithine racemase
VATEGTFITVDRDGPIARLILDRPEKRNALGDDLLRQLNAAIAGFQDDTETRVIILGAAPPIFCAGAETGLKAESSDAEKRDAFKGRKSQFRRLFERATSGLEKLEQLTVAAINGHAIGGGWGLAMACDFRIASDAAQFWIPEVDLGVLLGVGTTTRLIRLVGPARAKEIILLGGRYTAADFLEMGLLTGASASEELNARVEILAKTLSEKPFLQLSQMKTRIDHIARTAAPEVNAVIDAILER